MVTSSADYFTQPLHSLSPEANAETSASVKCYVYSVGAVPSVLANNTVMANNSIPDLLQDDATEV